MFISRGILNLSKLFVKLNGCDALEFVEVDEASPANAHAVDNQTAADVYLWKHLSVYGSKFIL